MNKIDKYIIKFNDEFYKIHKYVVCFFSGMAFMYLTSGLFLTFLGQTIAILAIWFSMKSRRDRDNEIRTTPEI